MKNKKIIYFILVLTIILAGVFYLKKDDIKLFANQNSYDDNIKFLKNKKNWKEIDSKENGIYLLSSKDCPYCVKFSSAFEYIITNIENKTDCKSYLVEINMDVDFEDKEFEKFYQKYNLETIPSVLLIKDGKYKVFPTELIDKTYTELNK